MHLSIGDIYSIIIVDPHLSSDDYGTQEEPFLFYMGINSLFTGQVDRITTKFAVTTSAT